MLSIEISQPAISLLTQKYSEGEKERRKGGKWGERGDGGGKREEEKEAEGGGGGWLERERTKHLQHSTSQRFSYITESSSSALENYQSFKFQSSILNLHFFLIFWVISGGIFITSRPSHPQRLS